MLSDQRNFSYFIELLEEVPSVCVQELRTIIALGGFFLPPTSWCVLYLCSSEGHQCDLSMKHHQPTFLKINVKR